MYMQISYDGGPRQSENHRRRVNANGRVSGASTRLKMHPVDVLPFYPFSQKNYLLRRIPRDYRCDQIVYF